MPRYKRTYVAGGMFFFTLVTHLRRPLFTNPKARECLHLAIQEEQSNHPFDMTAIVLLPDHLHCVWRLPENDEDYSRRWGRIKSKFTKLWLAQSREEIRISKARHLHREKGVWQKRFWEHRIRDENDFMRHVNYIHYNPVKHDLVRCPHKWTYSSFKRWVDDGYYHQDWLCDCSETNPSVQEYLQEGDLFGE